MSVLLRGSRRTRRAPGRSVREVCLLGVSRPSSAWASGEQLTWWGRVYRVEPAVPEAAPAGTLTGAVTAPRYVHLAALDEG